MGALAWTNGHATALGPFLESLFGRGKRRKRFSRAGDATDHQLYKLTDQEARSRDGCQWGAGVTHTAPGQGGVYGRGWLHACTDPLVALLMNPIQGRFARPRLWLARGAVGVQDHGLEVGCTSLTMLEELGVPALDMDIVSRVVHGCVFAALGYERSAMVTVEAVEASTGDPRMEAHARMHAAWAIHCAAKLAVLDVAAIAWESVDHLDARARIAAALEPLGA